MPEHSFGADQWNVVTNLEVAPVRARPTYLTGCAVSNHRGGHRDSTLMSNGGARGGRSVGSSVAGYSLEVVAPLRRRHAVIAANLERCWPRFARGRERTISELVSRRGARTRRGNSI